jgi:hypothetical protein
VLDAALGNPRERGNRQRHLVRGERQRLAVKISSAQYRFRRTVRGRKD